MWPFFCCLTITALWSCTCQARIWKIKDFLLGLICQSCLRHSCPNIAPNVECFQCLALPLVECGEINCNRWLVHNVSSQRPWLGSIEPCLHQNCVWNVYLTFISDAYTSSFYKSSFSLMFFFLTGLFVCVWQRDYSHHWCWCFLDFWNDTFPCWKKKVQSQFSNKVSVTPVRQLTALSPAESVPASPSCVLYLSRLHSEMIWAASHFETWLGLFRFIACHVIILRYSVFCEST